MKVAKILECVVLVAAMVDKGRSQASVTNSTENITSSTVQETTAGVAEPLTLPWYIITIIVLGALCVLLLIIILIIWFQKGCGRQEKKERRISAAEFAPPLPLLPTPPVSPQLSPTPNRSIEEVVPDCPERGVTSEEPLRAEHKPDDPDTDIETRSETTSASVARAQPPVMQAPPSVRMSQEAFAPRFRLAIHPIAPPINAVVSRNIPGSLTDNAMASHQDHRLMHHPDGRTSTPHHRVFQLPNGI